MIRRVIFWTSAAGALLGAGVSGLIALAARSDFRFRGCGEIARADWPQTANCADGWFGMVAFGGAAVVLAVLAGWMVWRGYA
ncbi:MAG: hypothetical protein AAGM21_04345 [Pseudomonadota bacterium]